MPSPDISDYSLFISFISIVMIWILETTDARQDVSHTLLKINCIKPSTMDSSFAIPRHGNILFRLSRPCHLPSFAFFLRDSVPPSFPRKDSSFFIFPVCAVDLAEAADISRWDFLRIQGCVLNPENDTLSTLQRAPGGGKNATFKRYKRHRQWPSGKRAYIRTSSKGWLFTQWPGQSYGPPKGP